MRYDLHLLDGSEKFEDLVISLCKKLLGISAHKFRQGKDGGRDSRFDGTAQQYPSSSVPWGGKFIIQAKFTDSAVGSCSDSSFVTQIKNEELPRIKNLKNINDVDNYILFTNRRLTAGKHQELRDWLKEETGIANLDIHGYEDLCAWITPNKFIVDEFGLNRLAQQLHFYETDIKEIILAFHKNIPSAIGAAISNIDFTKEYISKVEKNQKNNLSKEYFDDSIKASLAYFSDITKFLNDPKNAEFRDAYNNTVAELQHKISIKRDEFDKFEELFDVLYDYVLENNRTEIAKKRSLILVFLHFMYFNCDIGRK